MNTPKTHWAENTSTTMMRTGRRTTLNCSGGRSMLFAEVTSILDNVTCKRCRKAIVSEALAVAS